MQIFSHNVTPANRWDGYDPYGNHFRINDLSVADWVADNPGKTKRDFYNQRDETISNNLKRVFDKSQGIISKDANGNALDIAYSTSSSKYSYEMQQVLGAQKQWEKFADIKQNGGRLIELDIETFGDTRYGGLHDIFGITEIGIVDKTYGNVTGGGNYSLAVGITNDQAEYLNNILKKYEATEWDMLTNQERVALGRMSVYSNAETKLITDGPFKGLFKISEVSSNISTDTDKIRAGILKLLDINTKSIDVLPKALGMISNELQQNDNVVISLANGNFDLDSFINSLRNDSTFPSLKKEDRLSLIKSAQDIKAQELDVIYAERALAGIEGGSVETRMENRFGQRVGAAVDKQMKARHIIGEHIHSGVSDSLDQIKIVEDLVDEITMKLYDDDGNEYTKMQQMRKKMVEKKASDNIYFFHHGQLNKTKGLEFAGIVNSNGERIGELNYSVSGEYWFVDKENSKYIDVDGEQKYALTFKNAAEIVDGEGEFAERFENATSFTIVRDTKEEAFNYVENNAKSFDFNINQMSKNKGTISKKQILAQQDIKYSEYGRSQFDKMQDVSSVVKGVTNNNGVLEEEVIGGYNAFSNFINLEKAIGKDLDNINGNSKEKIEFVKDYLSKNKDNFTSLNPDSYYEAQAFVGMHKKLKSEMPLFEVIKTRLDILDVSEAEKTALFKRMYSKSKEHIDANVNGNKSTDTHTYSMSDVYGVDIEVKKGKDIQFHRINAYDERTAQKGISTVLNTTVSNGGVNKEDLVKIIDNLYSRNLILDEDYDNLVRIANSVTKDGLYGLSIDMASSVTKSVDTLFEGRIKGTSIQNYFANHVDKSKNLRFFGDESKASYTSREINKLFKDKKHVDAINNIVSSVMSNKPEYFNIDEFGTKASETQIVNLLNSLGIKDVAVDKNGSAAQIIDEIFTASTKSGYDKKYSLRHYDKMGVKSFVVTPDNNVNGSSFILMTREKDVGRLQQKLLSGELDFSSRDALVKSGIYDYAGFEELRKINRYKLSDTELLTVSQGDNFEKILTPYLNVSKGSDGKMRAYFNQAEYDFYAQHRKVGGNALEHFIHGEYEAGSRLFVKSTNDYLEDLSASASYRGMLMPDGSVKRVAVFGPNDFIQGREVRIINPLKQIFEHGVLNTPIDPTNLTVAQQVVHTFGVSMNMHYDNENDFSKFYSRVLGSSEFNEFFHKRLYVGTIGDDPNFNPSLVTGGKVNINNTFDQNFYQLILQTVDEGTKSGIYGDDVKKTLESNLNNIYSQLLNEKKTEKGAVSSVDSADYNSWAILHNPMRPTFGQQNNGMYFRIDDMDKNMFEGLFDVNGDNFQKSIFFGTVDMTELELADKTELSKTGYNPMGVQDFDILDYDRNFMAQVKQTSNYDLQNKYIELRKLGKGIGYDEISDAQYTKAIDYFEKQLMSLHEDKIFIASGLNEQELFASRDFKKMEMDWGDIDKDFTEKKLQSLVGKEIDSKTVIGRKTDGSAVFYNGPATVLTKNNVDELLTGEELIDGTISNRRITRILPTIGDIVDNKIMLNGAEKATVHAIDVKSFAEYIGLSTSDKDLKTALRISNQLFGELSGGAIAIANMGGQKHANMMQSHGLWNAMSTLYQAEGYGEAFVDYVNSFIGKEDVFEGFGQFSWKRNKIITNTRSAKNASGAIEFLYKQLSTDEMAKAISDKTGVNFDDIRALNDNIIDYIENMKENNIILAVMQRQIMNEHMGTRVVVDDRMKQAIITRGVRPGGDGIQKVDVDWFNALDEFAKNYDGTGQYNVPKTLSDFLNEYGKSKNRHRLSNNGAQESLQNTVVGINESLSFIKDPNDIDIDGSNIVKVKLSDLINEESRMKGGLSSYELQNSLFFVDGKPSDFLSSRALDVNLKESFSIFIDLEGDILKDGNKEYKGMLIPIQNVFSDTNDEIFFKNTQGEVVKLINKTLELYTTPSKIPKGSSAATELSEVYLKQFKDTLENQISALDKDSDAYKAFNQRIAPASHQLLAQDEVSPLVDIMFNDTKYTVGNKEYTFKELVDEKTRLEKTLLDDSINATDMDVYAKQYDEIHSVIKKRVNEIIEGIKSDPNYYTELVAGEANKRLLEAGSFFENGIKYHGLTVAMGIDAVENMGVDFGVLGLDVVNDYLTKSYELENINSFAANNMLHQRVKEIAKEFEQSTGYKIQDPKNIIKEINTYIETNHGVSIRELNDAIVEHKAFIDILNPFREIGINYMEQVGTYADLSRYPLFRSQPAIRLLVDRTLRGNQLRSSSPILSLLSHVDHDGDTEFLFTVLNGLSVMKTTDKGFKEIEAIYKRFGKEEYPTLLAESISSMGGLKSEQITDIKLERAQVLKKFKESDYKEAIENWKKASGISLSAELTPSQEISALRSKEMEEMFMKHGFNSVQDHEALIAAMAARVRKINIGKISTPNYALRNALLYEHNNKALTDKQKQLINDTYFTLSNMFSEDGGLLSMGEQKVIDPKHGRDGMTIARTGKYSTGMSRIFAAKNEDHIKQGLREMLEAISPGIFGTNNQDDINKLLNAVTSNSMLAFEASELVLRANGKVDLAIAKKASSTKYVTISDIGMLNALKGLRGLYDIKTQIPHFNFKTGLNKGSFEDEVYELIKDIVNKSGKNDIEYSFANTAYENLMKGLYGKKSSKKTELLRDHMYFISGGVGHGLNDKGYVFNGINNGKYMFQEVSLETGEILNKKNISFSKDNIFDKFKPITFQDFKNNTNGIRDDVTKQLEHNRVTKSLNKLIFDKKGNIRATLPQSFKDNRKINSYDEYYQRTWHNTNTIFNGGKDFSIPQQMSDIEDRYKVINKYAKAYDLAVSTQKAYPNHSILKAGVPDNSGELIRQINQNIANNAEKYGSFDTNGYFEFNSGEDFLNILRNEIGQNFTDETNGFYPYIKKAELLPNYNPIEHREALDFLKNESYDIIKEVSDYDATMHSIDLKLQGFKDKGATNSKLTPLTDIRNRYNRQAFIDEMVLHNKNIATEAQNRIYKALGGTQQDLFNYFQYSQQYDAGSSMVGFGQYIGRTLNDLSEQDIEIVKKGAKEIIDNGDPNSLEYFAANATQVKLRNFQPNINAQSINFDFAKEHNGLKQLNEDISTASSFVDESIKQTKADDIRKIAEQLNSNGPKTPSGSNVKKKTLTGSMLDSVKSSNISMKQIGIGAAGLMALGLVNKALHKNDKRSSPLSPQRNDIQGDTPGTDNGYGYAPPSKEQVIYANESSGMQYKVSAKSKNYISDMQNARLINMSGGGASQIHSSVDNSGVSNNWLANRFAEQLE